MLCKWDPEYIKGNFFFNLTLHQYLKIVSVVLTQYIQFMFFLSEIYVSLMMEENKNYTKWCVINFYGYPSGEYANKVVPPRISSSENTVQDPHNVHHMGPYPNNPPSTKSIPYF